MNEFNEQSRLKGAEPAENAPELPLATGIGEHGERVLTLDAIPALAERLRLEGWKVTRKGRELICMSPRGVRIQ